MDPGYACVASFTNSPEPLTLNHAMRRPEWDQMDRAIVEELATVETFNTFEVCVLPPGKKAVGCRYVFKVKILRGRLKDIKSDWSHRDFYNKKELTIMKYLLR